MDITKNEVQNLLLEIANQAENPYRIYTGIIEANLTQILNSDNSNPYIRFTNAEDDKLLALEANYTVKSEVFKVTLVGVEPSVNSQYWISKDGGTTKEKVKVIFKQGKFLNSYWWLFVSKN